MRIPSGKRSGVTPIVAEVALIAVLLIATLMLAGITFGVFALYYAPAEVTAEGASCSVVGNFTACNLILANEGPSDTSTVGTCSIQDGETVTGSVVGGGLVPAGGSLSDVQCIAPGNLSSGSQVSGAVQLENGEVAYFIGTLQ